MSIVVPIHDFKARLSHYLAEARRGETVEVTSHRRVIARVIGVPEDVGKGLGALLARGAIDWSGGKPEVVGIRLPGDGPLLSDVVIADRG